jgi:hypothetical protein
MIAGTASIEAAGIAALARPEPVLVARESCPWP